MLILKFWFLLFCFRSFVRFYCNYFSLLLLVVIIFLFVVFLVEVFYFFLFFGWPGIGSLKRKLDLSGPMYSMRIKFLEVFLDSCRTSEMFWDFLPDLFYM